MPLNYKPKKEDRKRYEDKDGLTLTEVIDMAKTKNGWTGRGLARQLGVKSETMRQWRFRGVRTSSEIPRLLKMTRLAGLSDPQGIVIILRHMIPTELSDLKNYVGCTVRLYRNKKRPLQKRITKRGVEDRLLTIKEKLPRAVD